MHTLTEIADFMAAELHTNRYPDAEQGGVYRSSNQPVRRLGLALEAFSGLQLWVETAKIDALWLHRPWQLNPADLPPHVGVISHHLPFDESLTVGFNPYLATLLNATAQPLPLGFKNTPDMSLSLRPIGMLIDVPEREFNAQLLTVSTAFGGYDCAGIGHHIISRIAVVGAMNNALVREAADRGASLYLTGQYRKSAQEAVDETDVAVIAVGHRRTEIWGLRVLASLLHAQYPNLSVLVRT